MDSIELTGMSEIRYELKFSDYLALSRVTLPFWRRSIDTMFYMVISISVVPFIARIFGFGHVDITEYFGFVGNARFMIEILAIWVGFNVVFHYLVLPMQISSAMKGSKIPLGPIRCAWNETGITIEDPRCVSRYAWSDFTKVLETSTVFLLFIRRRVAYPIPKRAFPEDSACEAFGRLAQSGG